MESEIFGAPRKNGEIIDYEDLYEHLEEPNVKQDEKTEQLDIVEDLNVVDDLKRDVPEEWNPSQKNVDEIMDKHTPKEILQMHSLKF